MIVTNCVIIFRSEICLQGQVWDELLNWKVKYVKYQMPRKIIEYEIKNLKYEIYNIKINA